MLLNNHRQKNERSHPKKIPYIQGQRRSLNQMIEGVKLCLESNPMPVRDAQSVQTKPWVHQDKKTPQKLSQTCLGVFDCLLQRQRWPSWRTGNLHASKLGHPVYGINPPEGGQH